MEEKKKETEYKMDKSWLSQVYTSTVWVLLFTLKSLLPEKRRDSSVDRIFSGIYLEKRQVKHK